MRDWLRWTACCLVLSVSGCEEDKSEGSKDAGGGSADTGAGEDAGPRYSSETYAKDENWLCRPGGAGSRCKDAVEATEIGADNALTTVAPPAKVSSKTDCFYVYPTIDVLSPAGRVKDYANIEAIWATAKTQAEVFGNLCNVYAPLYHQVTISTYNDPMLRDTLLEEAYEEVLDAFKHYLAQHNEGHDIILLGHSQGSHMLRRLLQREFDGPEHAELRKKLSLAMLIGPLGDINVPKGERVGGSFKDIPICKSADERACVVTYSSYPANMPPNATFGLAVGGIPEGREAPCTNPAGLAEGKVASAGAYFLASPTGTFIGSSIDFKSDLKVNTPFAVYKSMYGLECKKSDTGQPYLAVSVEQASSAARKDPIIYDSMGLAVALIGLHLFDYNLATADLAALIKKHVEAR